MQARPERPGASRRSLSLALFLTASIATATLSGCGTVAGALGNLTEISATSASLRVNQTMLIQNRMAVTAVPLTFFVNGIQGGNSQVGTIDPAGLYTAPAQLPTPNTVTITATANGHPGAAPGSVALSILNPIPVLTSVTPSNITEGVTTIAVNGSQFVYGAQILWNGSAVATTFVSPTEVAAAITAPAPGTYPLLVSNPNPGSANSATLNVPVGPGKVVLKLDSYGGTDVRVNNSLNLGLAVTGTKNTGVTLAVNGVAGGNASVGTVGCQCQRIHHLHRARRRPHPQQHCAAHHHQRRQSRRLHQPEHLRPQPHPDPHLGHAHDLQHRHRHGRRYQGRNFINGAQVLQNGAPVPTTFNSGTQLTATLTLTQPGNLDLQVLNPEPRPGHLRRPHRPRQRHSARAPRHSRRRLPLSRAGHLRRHRRRHPRPCP